MKLKKGEQIHISNWIMKNHSQSPNSGFVSSNKKEEPESKIVEYPGAWLVVAPASVAFDNEVCKCCQRIYRFNHLGARDQCECRGEEQ